MEAERFIKDITEKNILEFVLYSIELHHLDNVKEVKGFLHRMIDELDNELLDNRGIK